MSLCIYQAHSDIFLILVLINRILYSPTILYSPCPNKDELLGRIVVGSWGMRKEAGLVQVILLKSPSWNLLSQRFYFITVEGPQWDTAVNSSSKQRKPCLSSYFFVVIDLRVTSGYLWYQNTSIHVQVLHSKSHWSKRTGL